MDLHLSDVDSARFGLRIGRFSLGLEDTSVSPLSAAFLASDLDLLVVRYPAAAVGHFAKLLHPELDVIHADTLLYFAGDTRPFGTDAPDLPVADGALVDTQLTTAVRTIFADYRNHYAANPAVDASLVVEGYVEWAEGHQAGSATAVVALEDPAGRSLAAVAAVTYAESEVEIDLAGVAPRFRRRGVYQQLLDAVVVTAAEGGIGRVVISTQAHNLGPQRAWARRGWLPSAAYQTVHLLRR
jgi:GNAT superfamily N-acetyltransferase